MFKWAGSKAATAVKGQTVKGLSDLCSVAPFSVASGSSLSLFFSFGGAKTDFEKNFEIFVCPGFFDFSASEAESLSTGLFLDSFNMVD